MQVFGDVNGLSCANSPFITELAFGGTDQAEVFAVGQRLTDASLKATIPMTFNASGEVVPFALDLNWQGVVGQLAVERLHQVNPGSTSQPKVSHILGYARPAPPSGIISDGATNYAANPVVVDGAISVRRQHEVIPRQRLLH